MWADGLASFTRQTVSDQPAHRERKHALLGQVLAQRTEFHCPVTRRAGTNVDNDWLRLWEIYGQSEELIDLLTKKPTVN